MLRKRHAADGVFVALAKDVLRGKLRPGVALPPERVLAARFGVSRIIVRQATHRLAEMGLARVRQGGATVALDPSGADLRVIELELQLAPEDARTRRDFIERELLSGHALLVLAERRASASDVAALSDLVEEYADAGAGMAELPAFEERFWTRVAIAADNRLLLRELSWWMLRLRATPLARRPILAPPYTRLTMLREIVVRLGERRDAAAAYLIAARAFLDAFDHKDDHPEPTPRRNRGRTRRPK